MNNINTIPSAARWLGFGGLLPFAATASLALYPALSLNDIATRALLAYGAVILSFLGGVRWGIAIVDKQDTIDLLKKREADTIKDKYSNYTITIKIMTEEDNKFDLDADF